MALTRNFGGSPYLKILSVKSRMAHKCIQALKTCFPEHNANTLAYNWISEKTRGNTSHQRNRNVSVGLPRRKQHNTTVEEIGEVHLDLFVTLPSLPAWMFVLLRPTQIPEPDDSHQLGTHTQKIEKSMVLGHRIKNLQSRPNTHQETPLSCRGFERISDLSEQGHVVESIFIILREFLGRARDLH